MTEKVKSVGDHVDSRCTKCKEIMNHIIIAMTGDKIARVQCNTCNGVHNHREPKVAKVATTKVKKAVTPRKPKVDPVALEQADWEKLQPNMKIDRAIPYTMSTVFSLKDLVDHKVFGYGIVKRVIGEGKVEILFAAGVKMLRCG